MTIPSMFSFINVKEIEFDIILAKIKEKQKLAIRLANKEIYKLDGNQYLPIQSE